MSIVWMNGKVSADPVALDAGDRGLTLGDGLFETICVAGGVVLWRDEHFDRLERSARELAIPCARDDLVEAASALAARSSGGLDVLRLTLTRGVTSRGLAATGTRPTLFATLSPIAAPALLRPVALALSPIRRNATAPTSRLKTLSYADNIAAARLAASVSADDALLLNGEGHVASTTIANIFLVKGDELVTPSLDQAILPGIMRSVVLALAGQAGFRPIERPVEIAELQDADAVFITNSLRLMSPVASLDGSPVGQRALHPLVERLCESFQSQCGRDPRLI
jgi:branched-chain amino acid aminotransferase